MRLDIPMNFAWTFAPGFDPTWTNTPLNGEAVEVLT